MYTYPINTWSPESLVHLPVAINRCNTSYYIIFFSSLLVDCIVPTYCLIKPSTDDELCVSSPHFTRRRRKFVQTFNFVQISWHCLHKIAGSQIIPAIVRGGVLVSSVRCHYTIQKYLINTVKTKTTIVLYSSRLNWEKNIFQRVV